MGIDGSRLMEELQQKLTPQWATAVCTVHACMFAIFAFSFRDVGFLWKAKFAYCVSAPGLTFMNINWAVSIHSTHTSAYLLDLQANLRSVTLYHLNLIFKLHQSSKITDTTTKIKISISNNYIKISRFCKANFNCSYSPSLPKMPSHDSNGNTINTLCWLHLGVVLDNKLTGSWFTSNTANPASEKFDKNWVPPHDTMGNFKTSNYERPRPVIVNVSSNSKYAWGQKLMNKLLPKKITVERLRIYSSFVLAAT